MPESFTLCDSDRVANCAACRRLLLTWIADDDPRRELHDCPQIVGGRIKGQAFCRGCLAVTSAGVSGLAGGMATDFGSPSPWGENSTRAMEGS